MLRPVRNNLARALLGFRAVSAYLPSTLDADGGYWRDAIGGRHLVQNIGALGGSFTMKAGPSMSRAGSDYPSLSGNHYIYGASSSGVCWLSPSALAIDDIYGADGVSIVARAKMPARAPSSAFGQIGVVAKLDTANSDLGSLYYDQYASGPWQSTAREKPGSGVNMTASFGATLASAWATLASSVDASSVRSYVNGTLQTSVIATIDFGTTGVAWRNPVYAADLRITLGGSRFGVSPPPMSMFDGEIAAAVICRGALSDAEQAAIHQMILNGGPQ